MQYKGFVGFFNPNIVSLLVPIISKLLHGFRCVDHVRFRFKFESIQTEVSFHTLLYRVTDYFTVLKVPVVVKV